MNKICLVIVLLGCYYAPKRSTINLDQGRVAYLDFGDTLRPTPRFAMLMRELSGINFCPVGDNFIYYKENNFRPSNFGESITDGAFVKCVWSIDMRLCSPETDLNKPILRIFEFQINENDTLKIEHLIDYFGGYTPSSKTNFPGGNSWYFVKLLDDRFKAQKDSAFNFMFNHFFPPPKK